ncbi:hypothetical protein SprV_0301296400 [Sparganum proliferum]
MSEKLYKKEQSRQLGSTRSENTVTYLAETGKPVSQRIDATVLSGPSGSGLTFYVCDTATHRRFLVDTGAQISVVPPTAVDRSFPSPGLHLQAANCSPIPIFDSLSLTLNIGLCRSFTWIFVIADVLNAILGSDFLAEFDLLVDCRRARLLDRTTVAPEDIPKTAVTTPFSLLEFIRMPFGLRNAAQTFQRFIDHVLCGTPFVYAYIDDLLVAIRNEEEHKEHLDLVFDRLDKFGVVINPAKCVLGVPSLEFLGHQVDSESLRPLPSKVEAVRNFPSPTSKRQFQRFLGMVNFYSRFLPNCADLMLPLTNMPSGPKGPLELAGEAPTAFEMNQEFPCRRHLTHASRSRSSAVPDGRCFDRSRRSGLHCFHGSQTVDFALRSHPDKYNPWEIVHLDYISQFTIDIRHIDDTKNGVADMLSRPSLSSLQHSHGIDLCAMVAEQQRVGCPGDESVSGLQLKDVPVTTGSGTILCDVSTPFNRPFVPASMPRAVFQTLHGLSHPGIRASQKLLRERFVWPGMNKDGKAWARSCLSCQRNKVHRQNKSPPGTFPSSDARFNHVRLDFVGLLPPSSGFIRFPTCVDRYTL